MTFQLLFKPFLLLFLAVSIFGCVDSKETVDDSRLRLLSLTDGELDPPFSLNILKYQTEVDDDVASIQVTAAARNLGAFITINNQAVTDGTPSSAIALLPGKNEIKINLISKDASSQSRYIVDVYRGEAPPGSDDNPGNGSDVNGDGDGDGVQGTELGSLTLVGAALEQSFQAEQPSYTASVGAFIEGIRVVATTSTDNQITVNGVAIASGETSTLIPVDDDAKIEITVSSNSDTTSQTYTIDISRQSNGEFSKVPALKSTNPEKGSQFGFSSALSGIHLAVGAPDENDGRGAVYLFKLVDDGWQFNQHLSLSNGLAGDRFGQSLSMQANLLAIGAMQRNASGATNSGEVYLYERTGDNWAKNATLTAASPQAGHHFGYNVVLSANRLAVATLRNEQTIAGQVYIFRQQGSTWTLEDTVGDPGIGSSDKYAASIDMDNDLLAIGSFNQSNCQNLNDSDPGSVRVYQRSNNGIWNQIQKLEGEGSTDRFGFSVDIDGNRLAVGAQCEDKFHTNRTEGAVYIYEKSDDNFNLQQKVKAFQTAAFSLYGDRVALSGDTLIVTGSYEIPAHNINSSLTAAGSAYLLERKNGNWQETRLFHPIDLESNDRFGISLSVDSGRVLIGAPGGENNSALLKDGAAYVFE